MEIKFQAWDEGNKVMHTNFQFICSGDSGNDWIVFTSTESPLKGDAKGIVMDNPYFFQQFKIRQFTGRHDRNGVEIYQGDIIMIEGNYHIVKRDGCMFEAFPMKAYANTLERFYSECVVVGNIYQHKQLIENDKRFK